MLKSQKIGGFSPLGWQAMTTEQYAAAQVAERQSQAVAAGTLLAEGGLTAAGVEIARGLGVEIPEGYQPLASQAMSPELSAFVQQQRAAREPARLAEAAGLSLPEYERAVARAAFETEEASEEAEYATRATAALKGGVPGGLGLGMLMTGGLAMVSGNGTTTTALSAGADPGTSLATTGVKAVAGTGITAALAALGLPGILAGLIGAAGGYGLSQLIGGDGGGGGATTVAGIPISGPGVPEPPANMVAKQWVILTHANDIGNYYIYFFKLIDGRIMCYNPRGKEWKIWRPKKMIVLSPDPRMSMIRKLDKVYNRTMRTLAKKTKALKLAH